MTNTTLDLDAARIERAKAKAAAQEGRGDTLPVIFGGKQIAELGSEFPLTVLEPLTDINVDVAFIVKSAAQVMNVGARDQQTAGINLLVDVLAANPALPKEIISAVQAMGRRLLGDDGYTAFAEQAPSWWDVQDLIKGLMGWYGVGLGESSPSPDTSSTGGETSSPTSSGTTSLTPGESGGSPETPGS